MVNTGAGMTQAGYGLTQQGAGVVGQGVNQMPQASNMTLQAANTPVSPTQYSGGQLDQYMNPFTSDVVQATQNEFNNQNSQQSQFLNSQNIGAGAFGGDRAGISQDILANQQSLAQAPVIAGLNQSNYNQALAEFNNQQQTGLGAQEYNDSMLGQMANQYGNQAAQLAGLGTQEGNIGAGQATIGGQYGTLGQGYGNVGSGIW